MNYTKTQRLLRLTVFSALLAAISIVCGKYLAFNAGDFIRFSFENLPIIFAGMTFGSPVGAVVGIVADLVGCLLVGYAINPIITVGAGVIGLVSGIYYYLPEKRGRLYHFAKISLTVLAAHIIGSVIIKSCGLSLFYDMPLSMLMVWRLLNYLIVGSVEGFVLYHIMKNRRLMQETRKIMKKDVRK